MNVVEGTNGRRRATYPAVNDGYDSHPRGNGLFDLTIKEGVPTVTYYVSDREACAWTLTVFSPRDDLDEDEVASGNWSPDHLHLSIGDMGYHSIPKDLVQSALGRADGDDVIRELARVFNETDAEDEIYELLQTYLELIDPDDLPGSRDTTGE